MEKNFKAAQTVYVVERDPDGMPLCVGWYYYLGQVNHAAIVKHDRRDTAHDAESLITSLLIDTAAEEDTDLWVFPIKDCYDSWETADRMRGVELLRLEETNELR